LSSNIFKSRVQKGIIVRTHEASFNGPTSFFDSRKTNLGLWKGD
jgi:hypothetical protein